eukprot:365228-Chlamydomonas_euryale.AAC.42
MTTTPPHIPPHTAAVTATVFKWSVANANPSCLHTQSSGMRTTRTHLHEHESRRDVVVFLRRDVVVHERQLVACFDEEVVVDATVLKVVHRGGNVTCKQLRVDCGARCGATC